MELSKQIISAFICASVLSSCTITTFALRITQVNSKTTISDEVCNKIGINHNEEQKKIIKDIFENAKEPLNAFLEKYPV